MYMRLNFEVQIEPSVHKCTYVCLATGMGSISMYAYDEGHFKVIAREN